MYLLLSEHFKLRHHQVKSADAQQYMLKGNLTDSGLLDSEMSVSSVRDGEPTRTL